MKHFTPSQITKKAREIAEPAAVLRATGRLTMIIIVCALFSGCPDPDGYIYLRNSSGKWVTDLAIAVPETGKDSIFIQCNRIITEDCGQPLHASWRMEISYTSEEMWKRVDFEPSSLRFIIGDSVVSYVGISRREFYHDVDRYLKGHEIRFHGCISREYLKQWRKKKQYLLTKGALELNGLNLLSDSIEVR